MTRALHEALRRLASEGLKPEVLTLTPDQFRALLADVSQLRMYAPSSPPAGVMSVMAPWGCVRLQCGGSA